MQYGNKCSFFHLISDFSILVVCILAAGCSSSGYSDGGTSDPNIITGTAILGAEMKNVPLAQNVPTEIKFTYTNTTDITAYGGFYIDVPGTLQNMTLSATQVDGGSYFETLWMLAKLLVNDVLAAESSQVTAHISFAGDPAVCSSPVQFGPYTITGAIGSALTSSTQRVDPDQAAIDIINAGSFEVCLVGTPPITGYLTLTAVELGFESCDPATADIAGDWSGTFICYSPDGTPSPPDTIQLTISHVSDNNYHYEDGFAAYNGKLCGNTFKFKGTSFDGIYDESGTFVFNSNTATKTSRYESTINSTDYGNCEDDLQKI